MKIYRNPKRELTSYEFKEYKVKYKFAANYLADGDYNTDNLLKILTEKYGDTEEDAMALIEGIEEEQERGYAYSAPIVGVGLILFSLYRLEEVIEDFSLGFFVVSLGLFSLGLFLVIYGIRIHTKFKEKEKEE